MLASEMAGNMVINTGLDVWLLPVLARLWGSAEPCKHLLYPPPRHIIKTSSAPLHSPTHPPLPLVSLTQCHTTYKKIYGGKFSPTYLCVDICMAAVYFGLIAFNIENHTKLMSPPSFQAWPPQVGQLILERNCCTTFKCSITQICGQLCSGSVFHWSLDSATRLQITVSESLACLVESGSVF